MGCTQNEINKEVDKWWSVFTVECTVYIEKKQ